MTQAQQAVGQNRQPLERDPHFRPRYEPTYATRERGLGRIPPEEVTEGMEGATHRRGRPLLAVTAGQR
jgi:hypothetical protein